MRAVRVIFLVTGGAIAVIYPFITVMLQARGFDPAAIGLIAAVSAVGFTIVVPIWGHLADVTLGRVRALQVAAIGGAVVMVGFGAPWPPVVLGLIVVVFTIFEAAFAPLADALAVSMVIDRAKQYGPLRLLTSLSFGIVVIFAGFLYDRVGYGPAPFLWAAGAVFMAALLFLIPNPPRASRVRTHGERGGSMRLAIASAPRLPGVLLAVGLVYVDVLAGVTFLSLRIVDLGGQPSDVGLSSGVAALMEVPGLLVAGVIAARVGQRGLFILSALLYAVCTFSWAFIDDPTLIIATRLVTGFAFAGLWYACVLTIGVLLPSRLQGTGQALFQTMAFGISAVIANVIGGLIYDSLGPGFVFSLGSVAAVLAAIVAWRSLPRRGEKQASEAEVPGVGGSPPGQDAQGMVDPTLDPEFPEPVLTP